jgi:hypothetical protein
MHARRVSSYKIVSIKRIGNLTIKPLEFPMLRVVLKWNTFLQKSAFSRDQKVQNADLFIKNPFAFKSVIVRSGHRDIGVLDFYSSQCGEHNPKETERSSWKRVSSHGWIHHSRCDYSRRIEANRNARDSVARKKGEDKSFRRGDRSIDRSVYNVMKIRMGASRESVTCGGRASTRNGRIPKVF